MIAFDLILSSEAKNLRFKGFSQNSFLKSKRENKERTEKDIKASLSPFLPKCFTVPLSFLQGICQTSCQNLS